MPHSHALDPDVILARPDLAELALEGVWPAHSYRALTPMQAARPTAAVRGAPDSSSSLTDQLIFGEVFDVLEIRGDMAWGRARRDGAVGHVALADLSDRVLEPTHRVSVAGASLWDAPGGADAGVLPLNALVTVQETAPGGFARIARGGWVRLADLSDLFGFDSDPAAVAERLAGTPYLGGARGGDGLDAAGLVQQSLYACGLGCPRALKRQRSLGGPVGRAEIRRGDLVFWPDHAALMLDDRRAVHVDEAGGARIQELSEILDQRGEPMAWRRL